MKKINPKISKKKSIKRDIHHISWKNHGIDDYITNALNEFRTKKGKIIANKITINKILEQFMLNEELDLGMSEAIENAVKRFIMCSRQRIQIINQLKEELK